MATQINELKKAELYLEYQPKVSLPPFDPANLHRQACSNDDVTIAHWRDTWIKNLQANAKEFGPFNASPISKVWKTFDCQPCIVAGSGPSLKKNVGQLKDRPKKMGLVSCLHNFHFMEDNEANVDFYVTLDAGNITVTEVYEGGSKSENEYWEMTKDRTLLAFVASPPELIRKWKGKIYWFTCPVPDQAFADESAKQEMNNYVGTGGNVLGASLYISKGWLAANPIIFVGADFSFGYDYKFHGWNSSYDRDMGQTIRVHDIYGHTVKSWQSYLNFKSWFEFVMLNVRGVYINATEGGCLGAYHHGNLDCCDYMDLESVYKMYKLTDWLKESAEDPKKSVNTLLF